MPTAGDLLRAIGERPDEDAPRLAYADWLSERGDPRGEFIRAQVEAERLPGGDPARASLEKRARNLQRRHGKTWLQECPKWARANAPSFFRGFVDRVACTAGEWCRGAAGLLELVPVYRLGVRGAEDIGRLAGSKELLQVRVLDLSHEKVGDRSLAVLCASPNVAHLTGLLLMRCGLGPDGARAVAESPYLTRLTRLTLMENVIGDDGARALADSTTLGGLTDLSLRSNRMSSAAGRALGSSPVLIRLERLSIGYTEMGPDGAAAVVSAPLPGLRWLDVHGARMGDEGARALARARHLKRLEWLDADWNGLTDGGLRLLAGARHLASLRYLSVGANDIGPAGAAALAASPQLRGLVTLSLSHSPIGDDGALALAASPHLTGLQELDLNETGIGPDGGCALAGAGNLGGLKLLNLRGNELDTASRKALRQAFGRRVVT